MLSRLPHFYKDLIEMHHLQHHYANYENGFGVTSRFWDMVFGTQPPPPPPSVAKAA